MMSSLLYLRSCCRISILRNYTSIITVKKIHSISSNTQLLEPCLSASTQIRTFWECFPSIQPNFYYKDGLTRGKYEVVYRAKLFNYAFYGQLVASCTLAIQFFGGMYYAYQSYIAQEAVHPVTNVGPFIVNYDLLTLFILTLLTIQNCVLFTAAQASILRVYYSEAADEFVFITLSLNPFQSKLYHCKPGDLVPLKERMLNIVFGNHTLNGKKIIVRSDSFKYPYLYNKLIGDHPILE